jgi:tRNA (guanine37-N1)-methyltransferase
VAADAGELLTLQRAAYVQEGRLHDSFDFPPLTDELADVEQLIADTTCLVARQDGRLVGSVFGRREADGSWFIGRLMVAPDLQGTGLGRRLLALIEDAAPPATPRSVLVTGARSEFNQAFYRRRGYVVLAEEIRGSVPIVVMERLRSPRS